ncbi:MAG: hypothetical protein ACE5JN_12460 [Candidatus Methylomirabilia bacterium]
MAAFVFWTGIYNIVAAISFFFPRFLHMLRIQTPGSVFWTELIAVVVIYLGIVLILCSRKLAARASIVYWEGYTRVMAFLLMAWFGFFGGIGFLVGILGIIDLVFGLVYIFGLPSALNTTHGKLLLDGV